MVHVDTNGKLVIAQNPILAKAPEESNYGQAAQEADGTVNADTVADTTAFLETFFKLYPTATEKELGYYVQDNTLELINGEYLYSELTKPVFTQVGENVKVNVSVKYIDNKTKQCKFHSLSLHFIKTGLEDYKIVISPSFIMTVHLTYVLYVCYTLNIKYKGEFL